jgi:hypothetical protein
LRYRYTGIDGRPGGARANQPDIAARPWRELWRICQREDREVSRNKLPDERKSPRKIVEDSRKVEDARVERGLLGIVFGTRNEKAGNIAGLALVLLIILFLFVYFGPDLPGFTKGAALAMIFSAFTGTLGYIFGQNRPPQS